MIEEYKAEAKERMEKSLEALAGNFTKIRTGRAHPSILNDVYVSYYGSDTPLSQVANISVEDARTLTVVPWEKPLVPEIEKAIMKADLGLNPTTAGEVIRIPMPALTEETRKMFIKKAKQEAENSRVSVRNTRRDILSDLKALNKEKELSDDELRRGEDEIQKVTDHFITEIEKTLAAKEKDLMEI